MADSLDTPRPEAHSDVDMFVSNISTAHFNAHKATSLRLLLAALTDDSRQARLAQGLVDVLAAGPETIGGVIGYLLGIVTNALERGHESREAAAAAVTAELVAAIEHAGIAGATTCPDAADRPGVTPVAQADIQPPGTSRKRRRIRTPRKAQR